MFKIHDDKVYFVAETPNINKVIEIFLSKDDRGTATSLMSWLQRVKNATRQQIIKKVASSTDLVKI